MNIPKPKAPHYGYSIWQFVLSLLALLGLAAGAVLSLVFGVAASVANPGISAVNPQLELMTIFLLAGGLATCALLLVPSVFYPLKRISGTPVWRYPRFPTFLRPTLLILFWPPVLLLGNWIVQSSSLAWLLLPVLHVLAIGLPVLWITYLAVRGLPLGSPQRLSGVIGSGLVLAPAIIMILEIAALIVFGLIGLLLLFSQPGLVDEISKLILSFQQGVLSDQELIKALMPWLARPQIILGVLVFVAIIVPMIEEALKPIGVWLLASFKLSPAAGFAAGAISGAGFAFFESFGLAGTGVDWTASVAARVGTGVIHILNAGLMGWALTLAWREKRYLNLGLIYLAVVAIHGAWNALAVLNIYSTAVVQSGDLPQFSGLVWIGNAAPYILAISALLLFLLLLRMNSKLRRSQEPFAEPPVPVQQDVLAEDDPSEVVL